MRSAIFSIALILPTFVAFAQELGIAPQPSFTEHVFPRSKISGGLIVGALLAPVMAYQKTPLLEVVIPKGDDMKQSLCVQVTTLDGTYEAENNYPVSLDKQGSTQPLQYPTKHIDILNGRKAVARVNPGRCGDNDAPLIPVLWNPDLAAADGTVIFFVNTGGAETVATVSSGNEDHSTLCETVDEKSGLKYSAICKVASSLFEPDQITSVYLDVTRNSEVESFEFKVLLGGQ